MSAKCLKYAYIKTRENHHKTVNGKNISTIETQHRHARFDR